MGSHLLVRVPLVLKFGHIQQLPTMLGKRKRHVAEGSSPGAKLRQNIVDLYGRGTISAQRCASLLDDAGDAHVVSCQLDRSHTRARDLQRALGGQSGWPPLYIDANVPMVGKDGADTKSSVAVLWPHEVLWELLQTGS